jgi:hypothetical protein
VPLEFAIDPRQKLIHVRCTGTITLESIVDYERRVVDAPDFDSNFSEIFDLREAAISSLSFDDADELVDFERAHSRYLGPRRCAFVAPDDINYGTARMYSTLEEDSPMETRVFRDLDSALAWLGVDGLPQAPS